jgi:hypothetical protein
MALMTKAAPPALDEQRVKNLRAQIDAFINDRVQKIKRGHDGYPPAEGVPESVLRNILMNRSDGCLCQAFLNIAEADAAQR